MNRLSEKSKAVLNILLITVVMLLLGRFILPIINSPDFEQFIVNVGPLGPFVIVLYVVLSHVFAPLVGTPMLFLGAGIFGVKLTMIYFYIGGLFSSLINFWIARKYGRKWVTKLAGRSAMKDIDNFVAAEGDEVLILGRIFGFGMFDFISYAAGLTNISFKKYYFITTFVALIPSTAMYFIYRNLDFKSEKGMAVWIASLLAVVLLFTFLIRHYMDKKIKKKKENQLL